MRHFGSLMNRNETRTEKRKVNRLESYFDVPASKRRQLKFPEIVPAKVALAKDFELSRKSNQILLRIQCSIVFE